MKPYLIRPRIGADESLYSHLNRAAKCNMVSVNRMSHSIGLKHPYQLRPTYHRTLAIDDVAQRYAARFKLTISDITRKIALPALFTDDTEVYALEWHDLRLTASDILHSPRLCPFCNKEKPGLVRDQWFLKAYVVCGYHLCDMQCWSVNKSQLCIPFTNDEIINFAINIDQHFSGNPLNKTVLEGMQNVLHQINRRIPVEPELGVIDSVELIPWPPKQLCLPCRSFR